MYYKGLASKKKKKKKELMVFCLNLYSVSFFFGVNLYMILASSGFGLDNGSLDYNPRIRL